jgi:glyoxylase-like metal-dependent hydrolase (beta-lactamase superfamily II)
MERIAALCIALWSLALGAWAADPAEPAPPAPVALAEGVWWIPGASLPKRQPDGNTVVLRGPQGLVVLDTGRHRWHREAILHLAHSLKAPIVAIVNSHWHLDHVSGNPDLKAAYPGARVYASAAIDDALSGFLRKNADDARAFLRNPRLPSETREDVAGDIATLEHGGALKPDVVIARSGPLVLAGRTIEVRLSRDGPTAGDVWIYDPATRLAAVGDLVTLPVPFLDTACVEGWKAALREVWETPFERLVPGHGKPMTRAEFAVYREAFEEFTACSRVLSRPSAECAAQWSKAAAPLLEANGIERGRAEGMAAYYVQDVMRPNHGDSAWCRPSARAGNSGADSR